MADSLRDGVRNWAENNFFDGGGGSEVPHFLGSKRKNLAALVFSIISVIYLLSGYENVGLFSFGFLIRFLIIESLIYLIAIFATSESSIRYTISVLGGAFGVVFSYIPLKAFGLAGDFSSVAGSIPPWVGYGILLGFPIGFFLTLFAVRSSRLIGVPCPKCNVRGSSISSNVVNRNFVRSGVEQRDGKIHNYAIYDVTRQYKCAECSGTWTITREEGTSG